MTQTNSTKFSDIQRTWHEFDVADKVLGRLATQIATTLTGKSKPNFVRNLDCGDFVVVTNAQKVKVTGKKEKTKVYSRYSGYPGGLKQITLSKIRKDNPTEIIRHAVFGMLPNNKLRAQLMKRLFIYAEAQHPYTDKFNRAS